MTATRRPKPCSPEKVIRKAKLHGFGGECGLVALAINDVVFAGRGTLVVATNWHIAKYQGRPFIGHVGVRVPNGDIYDATGIVDYEEFRAWGMVDNEDDDFSFLSEEEAEDASVDHIIAFARWGSPIEVLTRYANVPACATPAAAIAALQRARRGCK